jgi:hypothetical protein
MMPVYEFHNEAGEVIELVMPMSEAPSIGSTIEHDGQTLTRICSAKPATEQIANVTHEYPYVSMSAPRGSPGAGGYTKEGKPIITSRRNEREFCARNNRMRD